MNILICVQIFLLIKYIMVRRTRKSKRMVGGKGGYKMLVGSRSQVMNGTAYKISYVRFLKRLNMSSVNFSIPNRS